MAAQTMQSKPSYTSIPHCDYHVRLNIHMKPFSMLLICNISPEENVHIAKKTGVGCPSAWIMQAPPGAQAYTLLLCTSIGGCLHMHAWQAYLRHAKFANYHCSLQNRARVLPSGALFQYFLLSPFFTRTAIYFFTTSSWRHRQTEVCNRTAMVRICIPSFLMHWAMSIPMPAQVLAPLTKSSISFGITC